MNGLADTTVESFTVPSDSPGQIALVINASARNPSSVAINFGDISFDIVFEGQFIGELLAPSLTLQQGMANLYLYVFSTFNSLQE